jgi:hypothetical protein
MSVSFVMQVFFAGGRMAASWVMRLDKSNLKSLYGVPIVVHNQEPVGRWAVDHVSCRDERWVLFGPFNSTSEARESLTSIRVHAESIMGYRIWKEGCFPPELMGFYLWTDG